MFAAVFSVAGCSLWDAGLKEIIDTADRTGKHANMNTIFTVKSCFQEFQQLRCIYSFQPGRLQFFETSFDPTVRHTLWTQVAKVTNFSIA